MQDTIEKIQILPNEIEEQRPGRNKSTTINHTYINSGDYKRKFDAITENKELSRLLHKLAKKMLEHRSGTKFEDMYWIDLDTIEIVAQEIDGIEEEKITYSKSTENTIKKYEGLLTIHSHPNSFPPSIDDFNSNFRHDYGIGIIICHDGRVYMYSADEEILNSYYQLKVEDYIKQGYNIDEAQREAIEEIKGNFEINFKEVMGYDGI